MTALEIASKNYSRFEDKKEITELSNALLCVESDYAKRDVEGNKTGGFEDGVLDAVAEVMRNEFVAPEGRSLEIIEFCTEVLNEMSY